MPKCIALNCDCTEPRGAGHYIGDYQYCDNCPHTLAAHQLSKAEKLELGEQIAKSVESESTAAVTVVVGNAPELVLTIGKIREILRSHGVQVGERGRIKPELVAKAYTICGRNMPADYVAPTKADKPKVIVPDSGGLSVSDMRALLRKHGVQCGERGRLSPEQKTKAIELAGKAA